MLNQMAQQPGPEANRESNTQRDAELTGQPGRPQLGRERPVAKRPPPERPGRRRQRLPQPRGRPLDPGHRGPALATRVDLAGRLGFLWVGYLAARVANHRVASFHVVTTRRPAPAATAARSSAATVAQRKAAAGPSAACRVATPAQL